MNEAVTLRLIERMDMEGNFHTVRMIELKKDDIFRLSDDYSTAGSIWKASEDAKIQPNGIAGLVGDMLFTAGQE